MPGPKLIDHVGLDSVVYLRIYLTGLKIFVLIACLSFTVMVPVNWTNRTLEQSKLTYSDIDKLSISNIPTRSNRYLLKPFRGCLGSFLIRKTYLVHFSVFG